MLYAHSAFDASNTFQLMCINEKELILQFTRILTVQPFRHKTVLFLITNIRLHVVQVEVSAGFKARFYNYTAKPLSLISALLPS